VWDTNRIFQHQTVDAHVVKLRQNWNTIRIAAPFSDGSRVGYRFLP